MLNNLNDKIQVPFAYNHLGQPPVISSIKRSQFQAQAQSEFQEKLQKAQVKLPQKVSDSISSVVAAAWPDGHLGLDSRPRVFDGILKSLLLLDTGSAVTAIAAGPDDVPNPRLALRAANGSVVECCGYKQISVRIGRKHCIF